MAIWFTSDLHLNHNREFVYKPRGFNCIEDMNEAIFRTWKEQVKDSDIVYILGDLGLNITENQLKEYVERLNGDIHIILGNHDTPNRIKVYEQCSNVSEITYAKMLKYKGHKFYLSHYPSLVSNNRGQPLINLCGHTHTKNPLEHWSLGNIIHVELDAWNMKLVNIDEVLEFTRNKNN